MKNIAHCLENSIEAGGENFSIVVRTVTLLCLLFASPIVFCQMTERLLDDQRVLDSTTKKFDQNLWKIKEGSDYPFRDQMLEDVVYNDTIRSLTKAQLIELLGSPDRTNEGYLYYRIKERRLWFWVLHAKTMVIKLTTEETVDWIKIHG